MHGGILRVPKGEGGNFPLERWQSWWRVNFCLSSSPKRNSRVLPVLNHKRSGSGNGVAVRNTIASSRKETDRNMMKTHNVRAFSESPARIQPSKCNRIMVLCNARHESTVHQHQQLATMGISRRALLLLAAVPGSLLLANTAAAFVVPPPGLILASVQYMLDRPQRAATLGLVACHIRPHWLELGAFRMACSST